ncbi:hypothetical protein BV25DRAFT_1813895 [Artomyces pyxidatus]|uniref:Uncharacterized protein n=1 Tax=Artomyces pyxidatus TaxID=48021 RepID=A0ACB8SKF2_9AGAM|nr:hypothetical protein BV25DRAFT_1813895 [Artomyces pyxidatus]
MFSPRSSNYERLEGGMGPSRLGVRNFAWKKLAIAVTVLVGLVWFFQPTERTLWGTKEPVWTGPVKTGIDYDPLPPPYPTPHEDDVAAPTHTTPSVPRPTSFESDPDPLKTVYCTTPHSSTTRLVQYALMIDAGSTGSRIHIYKFHNCGPSPTYEYEVFRQTKPGLSAYSGKPEQAAASLDKLLDVALQIVPEALRKCTPVAVKATAGLRLLGQAQSAEILAAVRHRLETQYPFPFPSAGADAVSIMDGKDEGVYAWITANYLLDTIRADSPPDAQRYAVLDLGGASTQIVFEPVFDTTKPDSALQDGEHKYELKFGGRTHVLYQHSYLGYGLMRARRGVHKLVDFMSTMRTSGGGRSEIANPCLSRGTKRVVDILGPTPDKDRKVAMAGEDIGGFESCNRVVELVMAKDAICEVKPCSFDGVYQPSLLDTFPNGKILLLSYFYDRTKPLLPTPFPDLTIATLAELATDVCLGRPSWEKRWAGNADALEELENRPEYCLDLTFMHALLRLGYEFGDARQVEIGKQINGTELGWALGAAIAMVGGELECKV